MKLNAASLILVILGCLALIGGVGWIFRPAGAILAGILAVAAGILLLERPERGDRA
jgi:hypothetical protein